MVTCYNYTINLNQQNYYFMRNRGSLISAVSDYGLDDRGSIPGRGQRIFLLVSASRPALWPTQPPIQWVPVAPSRGVKGGRGVTLTTHSHLVPRSRMSRSYTFFPPQAPPWRVAGQIYFTYYFMRLVICIYSNSCLHIFLKKE
jgi:hypothetical protein